MLVLHIEADTIIELKRQALAALDLGRIPDDFPQKGPPERAEPEEVSETKRGRGRPPKTPVPETEAVEMPAVVFKEDDTEVEVDQPPLNDTIADEKTKAEVIRTLQTIYNSGKVQVIRHVLSKYGQGAKSFPEIEASRFPAIKEALARGEIA